MSEHTRRVTRPESAGVSRRKFLEQTATFGGAAIITAAGVASAQQTNASNQNTGPTKPVELTGAMIEYQSNDLKIPAYLSLARNKNAPAILVIHEVFGLNDHIKSIADRFSHEGFNALAPNLFVRATVPPPKDATDMQALRKAASSIPNEVAIKDMQAGLDYLKTVKNVRKRFGSI